MEIKLPPNLNAEKNGMGLAVSAVVSVRERPTAFLNNEDSEFSTIRLVCHLDTDQAYCLNPSNIILIRNDNPSGYVQVISFG